MARRKKASDEIYNARRRYRRQAERLSKQAENAIGAEKSRLRAQAADALEHAMQTYEKPQSARKKATGIEQLSEKLGDLVRKRKPIDYGDIDVKELGRESLKALESTELTPDDEAKEILKRGNIGNRFYAGFIDVWKGKEGEDINAAILEEFGAENMMQVLEELENAGIDIYAAPEQGETYTDVATAIQNYIAEKQNA